MNTLALDTSSARCSVILQSGSRQFFRMEEASRQHSRHILQMIDSVLSEAGITPPDLDLLAWNAGPGSFTGLRIGASVVQALSYSLHVPVLSLSALEVLAFRAAKGLNLAGARIAVAQDARMNGIYWAVFAYQAGTIRRMEEDQLVAADVMASRLQPLFSKDSWIITGDGWSLFAGDMGIETMDNVQGKQDLPDYAEAAAMLELALEKDPSERQLHPANCVPYYINEATHWKKKTAPISTTSAEG